MTGEINSLLKLYLGSDECGGYQPIGCEDRVREAFPDDYEQKMGLIAPYLDDDHTADWAKNDLVTETRLFKAELGKKYPELNVIIIRALANRWSFGWK